MRQHTKNTLSMPWARSIGYGLGIYAVVVAVVLYTGIDNLRQLGMGQRWTAAIGPLHLVYIEKIPGNDGFSLEFTVQAGFFLLLVVSVTAQLLLSTLLYRRLPQRGF
jgi:hypothetical protein